MSAIWRIINLPMLHARSTHCSRAIERPLVEKTSRIHGHLTLQHQARKSSAGQSLTCLMYNASRSHLSFRTSFLPRRGVVEAKTSCAPPGASVPERHPATHGAPQSKVGAAPLCIEHAGPSVRAMPWLGQATHWSASEQPNKGEKACGESCGGRARPTR